MLPRRGEQSPFDATVQVLSLPIPIGNDVVQQFQMYVENVQATSLLAQRVRKESVRNVCIILSPLVSVSVPLSAMMKDIKSGSAGFSSFGSAPATTSSYVPAGLNISPSGEIDMSGLDEEAKALWSKLEDLSSRDPEVRCVAA